MQNKVERKYNLEGEKPKSGERKHYQKGTEKPREETQKDWSREVKEKKGGK